VSFFGWVFYCQPCYEVGDLTAAAEAVLVRKIDAESAVALLGLADQLGTAGLRRAAFKYIAARPSLLTTDSLAELPDHLRCDLRNVADPDPVSGVFLTPGSGKGFFPEGMTTHFFHPSLLLLVLDLGSEIRDPGWVKSGSRIRDKHAGSATLD
jgi:hypothetical protein